MICVYCNGTGKLPDPAPWAVGDRCFTCSGTGHVEPPRPKVKILWGSGSREDCARIPGVERFTVGMWSGSAGGFPVVRSDEVSA